MAATAVDQEILEVESEFWRAIRDGDAEHASAMMDESCLVTGAQGTSAIDAAIFKKLMQDGKWTLHEFGFDSVHVVRPTDDVAVISYVVTEKLTVEGKPLTVKAADASTWVNRGGKWRCALHTESVLGDPFGRDRVATNNR